MGIGFEQIPSEQSASTRTGCSFQVRHQTRGGRKLLSPVMPVRMIYGVKGCITTTVTGGVTQTGGRLAQVSPREAERRHTTKQHPARDAHYAANSFSLITAVGLDFVESSDGFDSMRNFHRVKTTFLISWSDWGETRQVDPRGPLA